MPDDRSSGYFGGSSFVRFNSADTSGSASGIPDKKRSKEQQAEAEKDEKDEETNKDGNQNNSEFVDRSAQLRASLNSLAMLNFSSVIKDKNNPNNPKTLINSETEKADK